MTRIADSIDDVMAVIEAIDANYVPSLASQVWSSLLAVLFGAGLPAIVLFVLFREGTVGLQSAILIGLAISGPYMGLEILLNQTSSYRVDPLGFARDSPIGIGSWIIEPSEVESIEIKRAQFLWALNVKPKQGKNRSIPLHPVLCSGLSTIYPWLGTGESNIEISSRIRPFVYALLAVTILFAVALAIWYRAQGF